MIIIAPNAIGAGFMPALNEIAESNDVVAMIIIAHNAVGAGFIPALNEIVECQRRIVVDANVDRWLRRGAVGFVEGDHTGRPYTT